MILPNVRSIILAKTILPRNTHFFCLRRSIGTSSKDSLPSVALDNVPKSEIRKTRRNLNWKSYGFDYIDQRADIFHMHAVSFFLFTVLLYGITFLLAYYPDLEDVDWIHREAHIQLRRREILGLPLVDKNYADPTTVILPADEDIGDDEIII